MKNMRVLVGCEESGKVLDAFAKLGHDAWSNDLVPCRGVDQSRHLLMDVKEAIRDAKWDIIILHPPCTALSLSGNRWYGRGLRYHPERLRAIKWTSDLWSLAKKNALIGCALENPTSVVWQHIGKPQYIQPWQFGHGEQKKTGILTHGLPALTPTKIVKGREQRIWRMALGINRKRDRSETFQGIADAMADQWGNLK